MSVSLPAERSWQPLLDLALAEDLGPGDVTTQLVLPAGARGRARLEAREPLVVCGLPIARAVFRQVDPALDFTAHAAEGEHVAAGARLATVTGPLAGLLAGERTALNFLGRLCGIASLARRFVEAIQGSGAQIVDTRKTLPGWRALDKYATAVGGARNHRHGLFDGILIKDNHVAAAGSVSAAVKAALSAAPAHLRVQVEVESEEQALAAVEAGARFLLLDNLPPERMRSIATRLEGRALLEASGGVSLENVRRVADSGVQRVSVGALTHSAAASDVALEIDTEGDPAPGVPE